MRIHERPRRNAPLAAVLVLPLFLMSFAAKCDRKPPNDNNSQAAAFPVKADESLGVEIRKAISRNERNIGGVSALDLNLFSDKGKVSITGTIANDAARTEVLRIAKETEVEVDGRKYKALSVDESQFTVKPSTPSPTPSPTHSP